MSELHCGVCKKICSNDDMKILKDGLLSKSCKSCIEYQKEYRKSHPDIEKNRVRNKEKDKATRIKYYDEHREEMKVKRQKYVEKNKETLKQKWKKYREEHLEECTNKNHQYYKEHQAEILKQKHEYYQQNKEKINDYNKNYRVSVLDILIKDKIRTNKIADNKYKRAFDETDYITIDFIKGLLTGCDNKCRICSKVLKLTEFEQYDPDQFSIDRIDSQYAHIQTNCQITCLQCNREKHTNQCFSE